MKDIIFIGEINRRNIDLNSQHNIDIFSISVSLMTPESKERTKLANKILEICKEFEGEISCPVVFDGSLLIRCRFNCYEAAEAFKYTIKLEYEK